jgi:ATP-dependent RNA helicase DDX31/DBP7
VYALEVQQALESCVENDEGLLGSGRTAFQSFVRAYSTHSKELKPFFNVRSLHLGHVARSFALRVAPSSIKVMPLTLSGRA